MNERSVDARSYLKSTYQKDIYSLVSHEYDDTPSDYINSLVSEYDDELRGSPLGLGRLLVEDMDSIYRRLAEIQMRRFDVQSRRYLFDSVTTVSQVRQRARCISQQKSTTDQLV